MVAYTKLSPNHSGQRTHSIDRITPHCVVGQCTADGLGEWFEKTSTIESAVREASKNMPQIDWNVLGNYEQMKETLMLQMIPVKGNEEKLAEIPHETVEDMAVVYRFDLGSNERGTSSALVTDAMRKSYGITGEQLAADAIDAAVKNHSASLWKRQKSKSRKPLFVRKTLCRITIHVLQQ